MPPAVASPSPEKLDDLPEEVLARIFGLLPHRQLAWVERVCRRCRSVVAEHGLWQQHCLRAHPAMFEATISIDTSQIPHFRADAAAAAAAAAAAGGAAAAAGGAAAATAAGDCSNRAGAAAAAAASTATTAALPGQELEAVLPPAEAVQRSAFFKKLHYRLTAPMARESLIAQAIAASSTDHPQESIGNVLQPTSRSRDLMCYWSSRGNPDPDSREVLTFHLAHPLCLVSEVQLRPFRAWFQWGSPIYAPTAVRFRLGGVACFTPDGQPLPPLQLEAAARWDLLSADAQRAGAGGGAAAGPPPPPLADHLQQAAPPPPGSGPYGSGSPSGSGRGDGAPRQQQRQAPRWVWESPVFEVESRDVLQHFAIPPMLCVGGYLRVELLGKRQRQAADEEYYTCICYLRALGSPIYNFQLRQLAPAQPPAAGTSAAAQQQQQGTGWQLACCFPDPLQAAGGLAAASEAGRLADAADGDHEEGAGDNDGGGSDSSSSGGSGSEGGGDVWGDSDLEDLESLEGGSAELEMSEDDDEEEEEEAGAEGPLGAAAHLPPPPSSPPQGQQPPGALGTGGAAAGADGAAGAAASMSGVQPSGSSSGGGGGDEEWPPSGDAGAY